MNDTDLDPSQHRRFTARSTLTAVGVLLLTMLMTLLAPAQANAAYYASGSGQLGYVGLNGPMVTAWDNAIRLANGTYFYTKNWNVGGITVGRSPASSAQQRVDVRMAIQRWDGYWVNVQYRDRYGYVSGTGTLNFPAWTWSPTNVPNNRKSYRVVYAIVWSDASRQLASTLVAPNTLADNKCSTRWLPCTAYTDGLNF